MSNYLLATYDETEIRIPAWVRDHASFLRWATSAEAPEKGKYAYLGDHLWIEIGMETYFHNHIKTIISRKLGTWAEEHGLGDYSDDGMLMSRPDLRFASQPDGMFISQRSWDRGSARLQENDNSVVLLGTPDMVLEVISRSSTIQDQKTKKTLYHQSGVKEYWMVDSRLTSPTLVILRYSARKYVQVKAKEGWVYSSVFGANCQLLVDQVKEERRKVRLELK
jgi:Uma2 family endonuclease